MTDDARTPGEAGRRADRVRLTGITATGYHGVFAHERREGQTFMADVVVHLDTRRAAATDDLAHTLDYGVLAEQVAAVLRGEPADLIETVAERIAATALAHARVQAVEVAVHKPQAPITVPFDDVVVEIRRDRAWLPAAEPLRPDAQPWYPPEEPAARASGPVATVAAGSPAAGVPLAAARPDTAPDGRPVPAGPEHDPAAAALAGLTAAPVPSGAVPSGAVPTAPAVPTTPGAGALPAVVVPPPLEAPAVAHPASGAVPQPGRGPDDDEPVDGELVQDQLDVAPDAPVEVVLAIGSNLGSAQDTLRDAVTRLAELPGIEVVDVSALARTAPVGGPDQPDFLNAVVIARTTLSPRDLLRATSSVEQEHGRERTVRWGPRTLDIDIIVYDSVSAVTDDLELPHPRAHERAFVLQPWAQVRPDAVLHGLGGGPVAALAATAPDRDGVRWLALDWLTAPVPAAQADAGEAIGVEVGDEPGYREP